MFLFFVFVHVYVIIVDRHTVWFMHLENAVKLNQRERVCAYKLKRSEWWQRRAVGRFSNHQQQFVWFGARLMEISWQIGANGSLGLWRLLEMNGLFAAYSRWSVFALVAVSSSSLYFSFNGPLRFWAALNCRCCSSTSMIIKISFRVILQWVTKWICAHFIGAKCIFSGHPYVIPLVKMQSNDWAQMLIIKSSSE